MTPDFSMFAGDSKAITVTVKDSLGAIVDLTGASITWEMSQYAQGTFSRTALLTKTLAGGGITCPAPTTGVFNVILDAVDTASLVGYFYQEAEVTVSGDKYTVLAGHISIQPTLIT